jgi:transcription elongation factor GreA-like protein
MMDMFYLKLTLAGNIMDENNREEIIKKLADVYKSLEQVERVLDISEVELFGSEIKSLNEVDNG